MSGRISNAEMRAAQALVEPCLFCGGMPPTPYQVQGSVHWYLGCKNTDCDMTLGLACSYPTPEAAIEVWNRNLREVTQRFTTVPQ